MGRAHSLKVCCVALWVATLVGCGSEPQELPPFGEVLVEVDTDLAVPRTVDRLRIDLYSEAGIWLESRDFATLERSDYPVSFSVFHESSSEARNILVRARVYREGRTRDYRGEIYEPKPEFVQLESAATLEEACSDPKAVTLGEIVVHRLQSAVFEGVEVTCEGEKSRSGLAAFRFTVSEEADYRMDVISAFPNSEWSSYGDAILSLRTSCQDVATELACNDNVAGSFDVNPGAIAHLTPGSYFILVGNRASGAMDLRLLVDRVDRFAVEPEPPPLVVPAEPRLMLDGRDATPPREPMPSLTVDRLALIEVEPTHQRKVSLVLSGNCLGQPADFAGRTTCIETEGERRAVEPEVPEEGRERSRESVSGSWWGYLEQPCQSEPKPGTSADGQELFDEQVCIPGGSFILGEPTVLGGVDDTAQPERMAIIPPFRMDRYEYSVGRYRNARRRGFEPPDEGAHNNFFPLELDPLNAASSCLYNETTVDFSAFVPEREAFPVNCVSWRTARALCLFDGGDLPTVAQREWAAGGAQREAETLYPWGNSAPNCEQAVWGRWIDSARGITSCHDQGSGEGPVAVNAEPWQAYDTTPSGVVFLGGGVSEWCKDSHRGYADPCWQSQPLESPSCWEDEAPLRSIVGSSWRDDASRARVAMRVAGSVALHEDPAIGFRCVYPDAEVGQ